MSVPEGSKQQTTGHYDIFDRGIPEISSARLTLGPIRERDIADFARLIEDRERNRYWGYDDLAAFGNDTRPERFYEDAMQDFADRQEARFAVRLDDRLIGEATLHHFEGNVSCEIGVRIEETYAGRGYGAEVYDALSEWLFANCGLQYVRSRCIKGNTACERVLKNSPDTQLVKEDDRFYYCIRVPRHDVS
ncbi:MAG: GNAT family N-acetyltransferase [Lachnospiraceae bacterium]|nr:GNAT family N-acetyltransferase [Lachnospiraceae bacterium]